MKTRLFGTLIFFIALIVSSTYPVRAASDITIAIEAGGAPSEKIEITFDNTNSSEASFYIYLRNNSDTELTGIKLNAVNIKDDVSQELVGGYSITFKSNDEEVPAEGLTLPAKSEVDIRLDITNFTHEGHFSGELVVKNGDIVETSAKLAISRNPNSDLAIVGFSDEGIVLTQLTNEYTYSFQIYSKNSTLVQNLQVSIKDFVMAGDTTVTPQNIHFTDSQGNPAIPTDNAYAINGLDFVTMHFTLDLPQEGDYLSEIYLIYNNQRISRTITLKRTLLPVSVDIFGIPDPILATMRVDSSPLTYLVEAIKNDEPAKLEDLLKATTHHIKVRLIFSESKGKKIKLTLPIVLTLDRKENETTKAPASYDNIEVINYPTDEPAANPSPVALPPGSLIEIHGREAYWVDLKINQLPAGEYTGILQVGSPDNAPVRNNIRILVREPEWWAGFWIALGIAISTIFRLVLNRYLKLAKFRIEIADQRLDLEKLQKDIVARKDLKKEDETLLVNLLAALDACLRKLYEQDEKTETETKEFENIQSAQKIIPELIDLQIALGALPKSDFPDFHHFHNDRDQIFKQFQTVPVAVDTVKTSLATLKTKIRNDLNAFATSRIENKNDDIWFAAGTPGKNEWEAEKKKILDNLTERISSVGNIELSSFVRAFWVDYAIYLRQTAGLILEHNTEVKEAKTDKLGEVKNKLNAVHQQNVENITVEVVKTLLKEYGEARKLYYRFLYPNRRNFVSSPLDNAPSQFPSKEPPPSDSTADRKRQKQIVKYIQWVIYGIAFFVAVISGYYVLYLNNFTWGGAQDHIIAILWAFGLFEISNSSLSNMSKFGGLPSLVDSLTGVVPAKESQP